MINLIGIEGPAQNGKDTVGAMLMKAMPAATRFAFADKLKSFLLEALDYDETPEENKEGYQIFRTTPGLIRTAMLNELHEGCTMYGVEEPWGFLEVISKNHAETYHDDDKVITFASTWRKLFQLTGTEWGRQTVNEYFWITPYLPTHDAIVTDVRGHGDTEEFKNIEAQSIIDNGGIVIRVVDPRKGRIVREHASEAGIDENLIAYTIVNDGTLEDLQEQVNSFVYSYLLNGEC